MKPYLIDSDALIDSQRDYYKRANFQPIWDCIQKNAEVIKPVYNELVIPNSPLGAWVKNNYKNKILDIADPDVLKEYRLIQNWIQTCGFWTAPGYTQWSSPDKADPWLIAMAKVKGFVIVSHERSRPAMDINRPSKKEPKITTVAKQFGVPVIPVFQMLYDVNLCVH